MRFSYVPLGIESEIEENESLIFQIENPFVMQQFMSSLYKQMDGIEGDIYLEDKGKTLKIEKHTEVINDVFNLDFNNRKISSKLFQEMAAIANDELVEMTGELNKNIIDYLDVLTERVLYPINFKLEIDIQSMLKCYGVEISHEYDSLAEQMINYFKILKRLCGIDVIFCIHFRDFFSEDEINQICESSFYEKITLIFVESHMSNTKILDSKTIVIDNDQCVIKMSH